MTESSRPLSDEDLSAALDGEASADVGDRLAADEEASGRLVALRAVRAAVATPVTPLGSATVDDLVANALGAIGTDADVEGEAHPPTFSVVETGTASEPPSDNAVVAPLRPMRSRRPVPTWLVAAAVAVVVALGLVLVWSGTRDDTTSSGTAASSGASSAADQSRAKSDQTGEATAGADHGVPSTATEAPSAAVPDSGSASAGSNAPRTATEGLVDLGTYADPDSLRETLAASFDDADRPATRSGPAPQGAQVQRCETQVRTTLNGTREPPPLPPTATHQGYASIAGTDVLVFEFATTTFEAGRSALVVAVGVDACNPVLTFVR